MCVCVCVCVSGRVTIQALFQVIVLQHAVRAKRLCVENGTVVTYWNVRELL